MKRIFILSQLLFLTCSSFFAQSTFSVELQKNSSLTINGTTNILPFKLSQSGDKLTKRNFIITATQNQNRIILNQNQQSIFVKSFNSENKMALRDFLKLVKADNYPNFHIQLNYFEMLPNVKTTDIAKANVSVNITITGKTKQINIPITSHQDGDLYTLNGNEKINIKDFGLSAPVVMMGLIRVNDWINIDFHIVCKITPYNPSQATNTACLQNSDLTNTQNKNNIKAN